MYTAILNKKWCSAGLHCRGLPYRGSSRPVAWRVMPGSRSRDCSLRGNNTKLLVVSSALDKHL